MLREHSKSLVEYFFLSRVLPTSRVGLFCAGKPDPSVKLYMRFFEGCKMTEISGTYTISQLHKYVPPEWASSLKNTPQHFVKVRQVYVLA